MNSSKSNFPTSLRLYFRKINSNLESFSNSCSYNTSLMNAKKSYLSIKFLRPEYLWKISEKAFKALSFKFLVGVSKVDSGARL